MMLRRRLNTLGAWELDLKFLEGFMNTASTKFPEYIWKVSKDLHSRIICFNFEYYDSYISIYLYALQAVYFNNM